MPTSSVGGPLPTEARQGRQNQKYGRSGERLLAGCIPYRITDEKDVNNGVEVLLVTRRNGKGWVLPKGGWESDEDIVESAALRETVEEAGVRGDLVGPLLGIFAFASNKRCFPGNTCLAHVFALRVVEQLDKWPEQNSRKRQWFSIGEAYNHLCMHEWMRDAFRVWIKRNNWTPLFMNGMEGVDNKKTVTSSENGRN